MPNEIQETVTRCPRCGRFVLRGPFVGRIQTLCGEPKCRTTFFVAVTPDGTVTIEIIAVRK